MHRFFINKNIINHVQVELQDENAYHIGTVLRLRPGEQVTLCDGAGFDYLCRIDTLNKGNVQCTVVSKNPIQTEPDVQIVLYQSLPKLDKMDFIIQKCVELGIHEIVPVLTQRVVAQPGRNPEKKLNRFAKISEAAAKQSGRGIIPQVSEMIPFHEAVSQLKQLDKAIVPYEFERSQTLGQALKPHRPGQKIGLFIGPEGGFAPEEIEECRKNGFTPVTLGKRILRTETAGMVALSIMMYELGEI